jgi:hypothetical protein
MLDQMSMPVLFTVVIVFLGLVTLAILVVTRIVGERSRTRKGDAPPTEPTEWQR